MIKVPYKFSTNNEMDVVLKFAYYHPTELKLFKLNNTEEFKRLKSEYERELKEKQLWLIKKW